MNKMIGWFKSAVALVALAFGFAGSAFAVNVQYVDANGATQSEDATPIDAQTTLSAGWYVVNADKTISSSVVCSGDVNLILGDGYTLEVTGEAEKAGLAVSSGSLTIYGQTKGTGVLIATGGDATSNGGGAGIGTDAKGTFSGSITIHGGVVYATGGQGKEDVNNPGVIAQATIGSGIGTGGDGTFNFFASIKVNGDLVVKAGTANPPTTEVAHTSSQALL